MLCQNCGKNEANVRYTQIINGVKKQMALCSDCAKELGIDDMDFNMPINFSSFLSDMFDGYEQEFIPKLINSESLVCDNCNMTYDEFLNKGKFGCEKCYENFENRINKLLKSIQGLDVHSGRIAKKLLEESNNTSENTANVKEEKETNKKQKSNEKVDAHVNKTTKEEKKEESKQDEVNKKINELKERLKQEIQEERYEDAAKTRDEINKLK